MPRIVGVRPKGNDGVYEVDYRIDGKRFYAYVQAESEQGAAVKRDELMTRKRKELFAPDSETRRPDADFILVWEALHRGLLADNLPSKTISHYRMTFWRMFNDFRNKNFPGIKSCNQLSLPFFEEYKSYYTVTLKRQSGWRAELIVVKSIMNRLYRLGYCNEEILERLKTIKKPKASKKDYPDISESDIKKLLLFIKKDCIEYYRPIYFVKRTGRRIEETTLIAKADVIWSGIKPVRIEIKAETTKRGKVSGEKTPLTRLDTELEKFIHEAYRSSIKHQAPYLFLSKRFKKINQRRVCEYLKTVSKEVLGIKITPHYFRHRFWTECGKNQMPMTDAMAISGNKDPDVVLSYYTHSTGEGMDKVLEMTRV